MVLAVDDRDAGVEPLELPLQLVGGIDPGEAATEDQDALGLAPIFRTHHVPPELTQSRRSRQLSTGRRSRPTGCRYAHRSRLARFVPRRWWLASARNNHDIATSVSCLHHRRPSPPC